MTPLDYTNALAGLFVGILWFAVIIQAARK